MAHEASRDLLPGGIRDVQCRDVEGAEASQLTDLSALSTTLRRREHGHPVSIQDTRLGVRTPRYLGSGSLTGRPSRADISAPNAISCVFTASLMSTRGVRSSRMQSIR